MSTTDGWLKLNFASCVVRKTRSLGALVLCSICNMVFVKYMYDMVVDTQFHKFHGRPFARVLYVFLIEDAFEKQFHRLLCSVVLHSYGTMTDYIRKQKKSYCKTTTRHAAQMDPHVRRNVYRPSPCLPRSRKLLLLLSRCCSVHVRRTSIMWNWSID